MKQLKINVSLIVSMLIIVVVISLSFFLGVCIVQGQEQVGIDKLISIEIQANGTTEKIHCWDSGTEDDFYVFLPAKTETVTIRIDDGYTAEIASLSVGIPYNIEQLNLESRHNCTIKKKEKGILSGNLIFMSSNKIPSLFIRTESGSMDYIHAVKGNSEKGTYALWSEIGEENSEGSLVKIQGRGNTSWTGCEKKGYKLIMNEVKSLLGLKESSTYLLIANARSNYLSNTIAFWLSEKMGIKYVPQCKHIDLYLNGEYVGNYILCEQITVGINSIDITNLQDLNMALNVGQKVEELVRYQSQDGLSKGVLWAEEPENVTGGFFLERDVAEYYKDEVSGFILNSGDHYVIKGPKYAGQREVAYIQNYMQETYDALASENGYNLSTNLYYGEYIDIDSFALKYALEEFLNFNDAGRSSAYYYKDINGKLYAGPGWDFEGAFLGNSQYMTKLNSTPYSTDWYEKLWRHKDFREAVIKVYQDLLIPALQQLTSIEFNVMQSVIFQSAMMDTIRWQRESFEESCNTITGWIEERIIFLNNHWLSDEEYISVTIKSEWQNNAYIYLKQGNFLSPNNMPVYIRDGFTFGGWVDQSSGELFDFTQEIKSDIILEALWTPSNNSFVTSIISKASQVIPELLFMAAFGVVFIIFILKFFIKEKKQ